jgi:hypothetical protein
MSCSFAATCGDFLFFEFFYFDFFFFLYSFCPDLWVKDVNCLLTFGLRRRRISVGVYLLRPEF